MDSNAVLECDHSLSTDLQNDNVDCEEERQRAFHRGQIAIGILSHFLVQLFDSRSSPSCCKTDSPDIVAGLCDVSAP